MEMLLQRKVDGIFCMSVSDDVRHLIAAGREVPVVLLNRNFDDICCVTYDNGVTVVVNYGEEAVQTAYGAVDGLGYRIAEGGK